MTPSAILFTISGLVACWSIYDSIGRAFFNATEDEIDARVRGLDVGRVG